MAARPISDDSGRVSRTTRHRKAEVMTHSDAEDGRVDKKYFVESPDGSVNIPHPTADDITWAKKTKSALESDISDNRFAPSGSSQKSVEYHHFHRLKKSAIDSKNLWRLQYLVSGDFFSAYTPVFNEYDFILAAENKASEIIGLFIANKGDIKRAISDYRHSSEAKFLIEFVNEQQPLWTSQSGQKIMRTEFAVDEDGQLQTHRSLFNFAARRISRTTQIGTSYINGSEESFSAQDTDTEIVAAYNALAKRCDTLPPIETFTSKGFVGEKPKIKTVHKAK